MNEENLINYYNKFNEDKRLERRHGIVEFTTAIKYIEYYLSKMNNPKILDVGAGTGKYSIYLSDKGYDVTAVELVKHNLKTLQLKRPNIKSYQGNALNLKMFNDESFDLILLFGPMYHLISNEGKVKALKEAYRLLKKNGIIMISYLMNDYAVLKYGFIDNNIINSINNNMLDSKFHINSKETDLYSYVRLEEINYIKKQSNLKRIKIISQDGATDYMRKIVNNMSDEVFSEYIKYHLSICERKEMIGSSSHVLDILKKEA